MPYVTYYKRLCPYSGSTFQTVLSGSALRLGPGKRSCLKCGRTFADGSIEWAEMTSKQRRRFLFGDVWFLLVFVGPLVAFASFSILRDQSDHKTELSIIGVSLLFALVVLAIFYSVCWVDISNSNRRFALN